MRCSDRRLRRCRHKAASHRLCSSHKWHRLAIAGLLPGLRARLTGMPAESLPSVAEILEHRLGEEMELNDRHLNPQMGRILRTLGFDKVWKGGEGAHLIDADGERYLDLFGGYGVFAIGRNHPEAIAAVEEVMAARTGNMPQLGVTLLSGVLAEQLLARAAGGGAAGVPRQAGTLCVWDGVQPGRGRPGRFPALEHGELDPDLICVAKALSGG